MTSEENLIDWSVAASFQIDEFEIIIRSTECFYSDKKTHSVNVLTLIGLGADATPLRFLNTVSKWLMQLK